MSSEITIIAPRSLEESERLAVTLAKSALLPTDLRNKPQDVLATLMAGAELGLAPMQALRGIQIIQGKPSLSADLMGALVKRRPDICEYLQLVESTPTKATYRTKRKGEPEPTTMSFTMEDAKAAELIGSRMYKKFPANMLRARCLAAICRAVYPDLCLGLYDSDTGELTNGEPPEPPPEKDVTPAPSPAKEVAAQIQQQTKARMQIVDVAPGQTEEQAKSELEAKLAESSKAVAAVVELQKRSGLPGPKMAELIKRATGKANRGQLSLADVDKVAAAVEAEMGLPPPDPDPFSGADADLGNPAEMDAAPF